MVAAFVLTLAALTAVTLSAARHPDRAAPTAGADKDEASEHGGEEGESEEGEEGEGDAEGLKWFFGQRSYPHGIPQGAYRRARTQASRLPLTGLDQRGRLTTTAAPRRTLEASQPTSRATKKTPDGARPAAAVTALAGPTGGVGWTALGPAPIGTQSAADGFTQFSGQPPFSGRITAIATHPTNSQVAYVGGAVGGVWKTTDGGATFTPVFDGQASLAIGSIGIDPLNPETVYVGTGEANAIVPYGPQVIDSYYGAGLYKSVNGGSTWTRVGDATFGSCHISAVVAHPTIAGVVVATVTSSGLQGSTSCVPGIYRSTDGGLSWTLRLNLTASPGRDFAALSLAMSPAAPTRWFAGVAGAGVYRSLNSGVSWTRLTAAPLPDFSLVGRVAVTVSPATPARVYAAMATPGSDALGVWTSGDGGTTWAAADTPAGKPECASAGGQCNYDLAIAASPTGAGTFTVGAVKLRRYTSFGAASSVVLNPETAAGHVGVHWDTHVLVFDAAGRMWIGTDGGAYRWDAVAQPAVNLNATLGLTQFYPGISGTTAGVMIGGAQDMATNTTRGGTSWRNTASGDGGYSVIDRTTSPATMLATSQQFTLYRSTDNGDTFTEIPPVGIPTAEARQFVTPMVAGTGTPLKIYAGLQHVYRSVDHGASWKSISPVLLPGDTITAVAQAPNNANVVWAATSTGRIFRTLNALAATPSWLGVNINSDPVPFRFDTDLAIDPTNSSDVWVTVSGFNGVGAKQTGHVFRTTNAGFTWTDASGNLPDAPANALAILRSGTSRTYFVGTDVGVFASTDSGATWARFQTGLPNLVVTDLLLDTSARRLVAATFGRGMFTACTGAAPAGDTFASGRVLSATATGTLSFPTTCASKQAGEPSHESHPGGNLQGGNAGGASVWLRWTAPVTGQVTLSTAGSNFDTVLAVYKGTSVGALTEVVAPNDDVVTGGADLTSKVTFAAVAGQTYRIAVDGFLPSGFALARNGSAKLTWSTG